MIKLLQRLDQWFDRHTEAIFWGAMLFFVGFLFGNFYMWNLWTEALKDIGQLLK